MNPKRLLFSLHDVAPVHMDSLRRAEDFIAELGIPRAAYLLVPDFHGQGPSNGKAGFVEWCRGRRNFEVEWVLHGWRHLAPVAGEVDSKYRVSRVGPSTIMNTVRKRLLTDGEGEFLELEGNEIARRLDMGLEVFAECTGEARPAGFVAPAWLFNPALIPALAQRGFTWTEGHRQVIGVSTGTRLDCPVVTWSSRTALRRLGSALVCPALERWWSRRPWIRIAVHPDDFDHPGVAARIKAVVRQALNERIPAAYAELSGV